MSRPDATKTKLLNLSLRDQFLAEQIVERTAEHMTNTMDEDKGRRHQAQALSAMKSGWQIGFENEEQNRVCTGQYSSCEESRN